MSRRHAFFSATLLPPKPPPPPKKSSFDGAYMLEERDEPLMVIGYGSELFRDDELAQTLHNESHLIPWESTDETLMVDRFDVRLLLDDARALQKREPPLSAELVAEEQLAEAERYRDLTEGGDSADLEHKPSTQIGFDYSAAAATSNTRTGGSTTTVSVAEGDCGLTCLVPSFPVPDDVVLPSTIMQHKVVVSTAKFVHQNGPNSEAVIRNKQAMNQNFNFLWARDSLHAYYNHILKLLARGVAADSLTLAPLISDDDDDNDAAANGVAQDSHDHAQGPGGLVSYADEPAPLAPPGTTSPSAPSALHSLTSPLPSPAHSAAGDAYFQSYHLSPPPGEPPPQHPAGSAPAPAYALESDFSVYPFHTHIHPQPDKPSPASAAPFPPRPPSLAPPQVVPMATLPVPPATLWTLPDGTVVDTKDVGLPPLPLPPVEVIRVIEKLADFISKNGVSFEAKVREREKNNPRFQFLLPWSTHYPYYCWRVGPIVAASVARNLPVIAASSVGRTAVSQTPAAITPTSASSSVSACTSASASSTSTSTSTSTPTSTSTTSTSTTTNTVSAANSKLDQKKLDRLEKARKFQALLALKAGGKSKAPVATAAATTSSSTASSTTTPASAVATTATRRR